MRLSVRLDYILWDVIANGLTSSCPPPSQTLIMAVSLMIGTDCHRRRNFGGHKECLNQPQKCPFKWMCVWGYQGSHWPTWFLVCKGSARWSERALPFFGLGEEGEQKLYRP